ncbi:MAG: HNH endonuclease [Anaerolineales bacterium]|nr:HNH endonuclease [Anaerolineales bacterium]
MSGYIPASLRAEVVLRANDRCEYCLLAQAGRAAQFHIDHVIPVTSGGQTVSDNLALACVACSLRKAAKVHATDPATSEAVTVFNPRQQRWTEHFRWEGFHIVGLTPTGRATIEALNMNRALMVAIREEEDLLGRHPASSS